MNKKIYKVGDMTQVKIKEKILNLESELSVLKQLFTKKPDFDIDKKNWEKVKSEVKRNRGTLYKTCYGKE